MVDDCVGRIVKCLKEEGAYDETLIVVTSDHGDFDSKYGVIGKSKSMDDNLIRTPLIISHPESRCDGSRRTGALVDNVDLLPTLLDYAGVSYSKAIQGCSLLPILKGERESVKDAIFSFCHSNTKDEFITQAVIRRGDWKYISSSGFDGELYNLNDDPNEFVNLINDPNHSDTLKELRCKLLDWHVVNSGAYFEPEKYNYWEDQVSFYDENKFMRDT